MTFKQSDNIFDLAGVSLLEDFETFTNKESSLDFEFAQVCEEHLSPIENEGSISGIESSLVCNEQLRPEDFSFLAYLVSGQNQGLSHEARAKLLNIEVHELWDDLNVYGHGESLVFVKIASNSNLCKHCCENERQRLYIDTGISNHMLASMIQQSENYCQTCMRQLFFILSKNDFLIKFIE